MMQGAESTPTTLLSIVIPTFNRPDLLRRCLDAVAIAIANAPKCRVEAIVTDDSGNDETRELIGLHYGWVRWARGPRRGPAANRNAGVSLSRGDWILFTDDDCIPSPQWVAAYQSAMESNRQSSVFEGKTIADRERRRFDEESPINCTGGYLWSCNVAIRRSLFDRLGGFCDTFPFAAMEDVDLRLRLIERGEKFPFVADAVVCHPFRATKGVGFAMRAARSYLHLVSRHPDLLGASPWRTCAALCARRTKHLLRDAVRYRFRGFSYAVSWLAISIYFEIAARARRRRSRLGTDLPAA